jgi:hypothetical protein
MLTLTERTRLAEIRAGLEKHRALGLDVSAWESEFFLGVIDRLVARLNQAERKSARA